MSRFIQLFCCDMASKLPFHGVLGFPQKKILLFLKRETRLGLARSEEVVYNVSTIKKVVYEPTQQIPKKRIETLETASSDSSLHHKSSVATTCYSPLGELEGDSLFLVLGCFLQVASGLSGSSLLAQVVWVWQINTKWCLERDLKKANNLLIISYLCTR